MKKQAIVIRIASPDDAKALLSIYAPYVENSAVSFEYDVPSEQEFAERIRHTLLKYPYLAAEAGGEILGYAYAGAFKERAAYDWAVETSIYVKMDQKRLGIGGSLHAALELILKEQNVLNLNACIACPEEDDEYLTKDSILFHEKLGYRHVGMFRLCGNKFNRWYHMVWMEKHIGAHRQPQPSVKPFPAVREAIKEKFGIL
jgi:phosphinothricin acetyltransferase